MKAFVKSRSRICRVVRCKFFISLFIALNLKVQIENLIFCFEKNGRGARGEFHFFQNFLLMMRHKLNPNHIVNICVEVEVRIFSLNILDQIAIILHCFVIIEG